jgi:hypothetical protein
MVWRLLQVNFTALHTSSATWTHALYTLAASPEWIAPLRAEIESVVEAEGLSKVALQKMVKVDAFFRESHRLNTIVGGEEFHICLSLPTTEQMLANSIHAAQGAEATHIQRWLAYSRRHSDCRPNAPTSHGWRKLREPREH